MDYKDYYKILEIKQNASLAEIKKAYRTLALRYHPDNNKGDKNKEEKFKELGEAYYVLSDKANREQYDFIYESIKTEPKDALVKWEDLSKTVTKYNDRPNFTPAFRPTWLKIIPHLVAIVVFVLVSVLFCKPVLDGNVLNQHDNVGWKGMAQNSFEYKEKTGHYPLWNPNLFSGMPNYQVYMQGKTAMPNVLNILTLGMPKPINFFLLACVCFYILCMVLRVRPIIGMLTSLAYAFSTYNIVLIGAGHDTQMMATALMPLMLAGVISIYEKKYWLGFALTTYGVYQEISVNHLQVTYYLFLVVGIITIGYLVKWIREKDFKHIGLSAALAIAAVVLGVAGNALILKTTSEYAKFTMRGGKDVSIVGDSVKAAQTKGLDTGYAFEYSLGKAEAITFLMPNSFGGYSRNRTKEGSHIVKRLVRANDQVTEDMGEQIAQQMPRYWGKLYTNGPAYLGVAICLLGIMGFVIVRSPLRWALLAATILGIFLSWGKYFPAFNTFLFEHLPMYNKFRSPPFAQVIPQLTLGVSAALALQRILFGAPLAKADFKKILFTAAGLFALAGIMYLMMDYSAPDDRSIAQGLTEQTKDPKIGAAVIAGLKADRQALFGSQFMRALGLGILIIGTLFAYYKKWIKGLVAAIILLVISSLDVLVISHSYFTNDKEPYLSEPDNRKLFVAADDYDNVNFAKQPFNDTILKDTGSNYRVFNMIGTSSAGPFSESITSYYHKSVGGYHPAKLRIYQDVIERYLTSGRPEPGLLNMLNTKYIVVQDPQSGQVGVINNDEAYGPCWLVKNVQVVPNRVEALQALGTTNLKETAVVDASFSKNIVQPQWDSASSIKMTKFDNDVMEYEANCNGPQFAVFSEIYYPLGWNAYIDGQKTEYCNVNYILRGLSIPKGKHAIKFVFEPASVKSGKNIMFIASIFILLALIGGLYMHFRKEFKAGAPRPAKY